MDSAAGPIAIAKSKLREMLSKCTALQSWDGLTLTEAQLLERIYLDALPAPPEFRTEFTREELESLRPFVLVYMPNMFGFGMRSVSSGSLQGSNSYGAFFVELHRNVDQDEATDPAALDRSFENTLGQLLTTGDRSNPGLWQLSAYGTYLEIASVELVELYRAAQDEITARGDYQSATLLVRWGGA